MNAEPRGMNKQHHVRSLIKLIFLVGFWPLTDKFGWTFLKIVAVNLKKMFFSCSSIFEKVSINTWSRKKSLKQDSDSLIF